MTLVNILAKLKWLHAVLDSTECPETKAQILEEISEINHYNREVLTNV